jgi:DNA-binding MarR family transcriptional regulator
VPYYALMSTTQAAGRAATGEPSAPGEAGSVVSTWRAMSACCAAATSALEHELGTRHGLGVSEFEVLERLAESANHKFRAQELAESVHLSQSALSRLTDRLARHGLVERCLCDMDRRGIYVVLTDAGKERYAEAAPTHRRVLATVLASYLPAIAPPER